MINLMLQFLTITLSITPFVASSEDTGVCVMDLVLSEKEKKARWLYSNEDGIVNETEFTGYEVLSKQQEYDRVSEQMPMHYGRGNLYVIFRGRIVVDKTLFVEKIINCPNRVIRITGPKRYCKSINLNMIRMFMGIEVDENGDPVPRNKTISYQLFHYGLVLEKKNLTKILRPPFLISKNKDLMDNYLGKYPIVRFDVLVCPLDYKLFIIWMKVQIADLFKRNKYMIKVFERRLQNDPNDSDAEFKLRRFKMYMNETTLNIRELELHESINFMCKIMKEHFKVAPIILIDDYGLAASHLMFEKKIVKREKVLSFYKRFFNETLQAYDLYTKAVITGVIKFVDLSGINDFVDFNLFKPNVFSPFYGFKRSEVETILDIMNVTIDLGRQVLQYYKGLQIGQYQMYNAHSIIEFSIAKEIDSYWNLFTTISVELTDTFSAYKEVRNALYNLVCGHSAEVQLQNMDFGEEEFRGGTVNTALKFFCAYGYFAITPVSETIDRVRCLNEEITSILKIDLMAYIKYNLFLEPAEPETPPDLLFKQLLIFFKSNNETKSPVLCKEFKKYLNSIKFGTDFAKILDEDNDVLISQLTYHDYVHDILLYLLSYVEQHYYSFPKNIDKFNVTITKVGILDNGNITDRTYTVVNYGSHGVLIEVKFNYTDPLSKAFDQFGNYTSYFHSHGYSVETVKHIVINILDNKTTNIIAQFLNISYPNEANTRNL